MKLPRLLAGGRRRRFLLLVLNGALQGLLAIASAWIVMALFEDFSSGTAFPVFHFAALLVAVALHASLRRTERIQSEHIGQHYARAVRMRLFSRMMKSNPRKLRKMRSGNILLRFVGDLSALRQWISLGLSRLLVAGVSILLGLSALAWIYLPFAAGVIAVLSVAAAWILIFSHRIRSAVSEARKRQANIAANVSEKLVTLQTIQACGRTGRETRFLRRQSQRLIQAALLRAGRIGSLRAVVDATSGAAVAVILGLAFTADSASLTPGSLVAAMSILGFMAPSLRDLGRVHEYWLAAKVSRRKLSTISQRVPRLRYKPDAAALEVTSGNLAFENVTVAGVLENVNSTLPGGVRIALSGENGSGKSTLLGLAGRLFDPDEGRILIDGQDLRDVSLDSLRSQIAYVSADMPLFRGTLRKNLTYGLGKVSAAALADLIANSGFGPLLQGLPEDLDARIRDSGLDLSQGQRMRIMLIRALLMRPAILLLDEADSPLDTQAIEALETILGRFEGTLLMATHDKGLTALCDQSWQLCQGKLVPVTGCIRSEPSTGSADRRDIVANIVPFASVE